MVSSFLAAMMVTSYKLTMRTAHHLMHVQKLLLQTKNENITQAKSVVPDEHVPNAQANLGQHFACMH